ncbi:cohesin-loading factor complex subunit SCC4 Ecym_5550 [Eremothecium cymbalariae DBVPG|uniref:Uncharacterized protein n=1 Tax=Eremothecium cymbalariae (strain CBS 270.75 / DBVPG 7215 / KCTC 17166 / NRRL Y-17582) TaxID=931890 RepID=I6NDZ8_ERECY|nr:hypothetical protein Ecym_5550 [Eremothecium cymbalariae DBVPG\
MAIDLQKHQRSLVYQRSRQYLAHAHSVASKVRSETQLRQYYTLIQEAIRGFEYLKNELQLTIAQDLQVTLDLVRVLLDETHEVELAEQYLNGIRTRLQPTTLTDDKYLVDFYLLYHIPMLKRDPGNKLLLKNLGRLIGTFNKSDPWRLVFQYCRIAILDMNKSSRNISSITADYAEMLNSTTSLEPGAEGEINGFLLCSYVTFLLNRTLLVSNDDLEKLKLLKTKSDRISVKIKIWAMLLELLIAIYQDENITLLLYDFKEFFGRHKETLNTGRDSILLQIKPGLKLKVEVPFFNSADCKNILLLFQSVSYLPTCYSKSSNFSTKFLPKVLRTSEELKQNVARKASLSKLYSIGSIYDHIKELCQFYQAWEQMILNGPIENNLPQLRNSDYYDLLESMNSHLLIPRKSIKHVYNLYESLLKSKDSEVRLIAFMHCFILTISQLSQCNEEPDQFSRLIQQANNTWNQIIKNMEHTPMVNNNTWLCTIATLWVLSKFEPFSNHPLPNDNDEERQLYLKKLENYYTANSLLSSDQSAQPSSFKLKKCLLLHFLLNFLGGTIFVSDIQERCNLSASCFQMCKQQHMPVIRYIGGIWHLINCTVAMKNKEVAVTRAKLDNLVCELLKSR